jgi:hypothetical protein
MKLCCLLHAGFLLGLFFYPEDGGDIFSETSVDIHQTKRCYILEDRTLYNLCVLINWCHDNEIMFISPSCYVLFEIFQILEPCTPCLAVR